MNFKLTMNYELDQNLELYLTLELDFDLKLDHYIFYRYAKYWDLFIRGTVGVISSDPWFASYTLYVFIWLTFDFLSWKF